MYANEQMIWYLASMLAKVEGMTAEIVVATARLDSAASATTTSDLVVPSTDLATTMLESSTPISQTLTDGDDNFIHVTTAPAPPTVVEEIHDAASVFCLEPTVDLTIDNTVTAAATDVPSSTTKAAEVLEVVHDASPACVEWVPGTCSTECLHHVTTTDIVNKGHGTSAAIFLEPVVDFNDITPTATMAEPEDWKDYQVVATTSRAVDIIKDVKLATPVPPMLSRYGPDIANSYADVPVASLISVVTRPAESVPGCHLEPLTASCHCSSVRRFAAREVFDRLQRRWQRPSSLKCTHRASTRAASYPSADCSGWCCSVPWQSSWRFR
ncbi:hypothetical protein VPH35_112991 [Triticum aestivum]